MQVQLQLILCVNMFAFAGHLIVCTVDGTQNSYNLARVCSAYHTRDQTVRYDQVPLTRDVISNCSLHE